MMIQTLGEYIFSKATNKRPSASTADSSSTLTGYIVNKVMEGDDSGQSFEEQLDKAFQMLGKKTSAIKREQFKQIKIATNLLDKQQDAQKLIADILNLTEERTALEKQFYQRILENQLPPEPSAVEEEPAPAPEPETQTELEDQQQPQKLAAGGTTQVTPPTKESKNLTEKDKQIKFADVMQLQPKASGIAAVSVLGEFLSALGPLAGFFRPYVKNIATPFAVAMGVSQSIINSLLGGPVQAGELKTKEYQKDFGKTWSKFLNDENFISLFIDKVDGFLQQELLTGPPGTGTDFWTLAAVAALEDGRAQGVADVAQSVYNRLADGAYGKSIYDILTRDGQYQVAFVDPTASSGAGTKIADIWKSIKDADSAAAAIMYYYQKRGQTITKEQAKQKAESAAKALRNPSLQKEAASFIQGRTDFTASASGSDVVERPGGGNAFYWAYGTGKMRGKPAAPIPSFSMGGAMGDNRSPLMPYLLSGPKAGYNVSIQGHNLTLHGTEVVVPFENGLQVYPVLNRRYNIIEDPIGVINRWKQIAQGTNTDRSAYLTAQDGISLGVKAIQHDEALSSLSRGKNDYIVHGGRSIISSVPWGKITSSTPLHAYETGVSGDRTTIGWGMTYYDSITNGKKAVKPGQVIKKQQADAMLKNLVVDYTKTLSSQKWYQKFWNRMSSSQQAGLLAYGYNQPAHLLGTGAPKMYAALNRGDMRAVAANIDRGLPAREKNEKRLVLSGPTDLTKVKTRSNSAPRVIVNRVGGGSSPSFVQQAQQTITRLIPVPVFNSHKLRTELNMKRSK